MGIQLRDIVESKPMELSELSKKTVAVDAFNTLYQFLATIRQPDGTPLTDAQGRITSHLSGLLYRTSSLMAEGIMPVFIFDGKSDEKKKATQDERKAIREKATEEWKEALEEGDMERARSKAGQSARLTGHEVDESRELLSMMKVPFINAPGEGEAQASHMARQGLVWAAASQDYDSLLFGAPRLVRNLAISGRRRNPRTKMYMDVKPEFIELEGALSALGVTRAELVDMAIMIGTDFNEGFKGIGPKTALKLIKEHGTAERALAAKGFAAPDDIDYLRNLFLKGNVVDVEATKMEWGVPDMDGIIHFMVVEHGFNEERVRNAVGKMMGSPGKSGPSSKPKQAKLDEPGKQFSLDSF